MIAEIRDGFVVTLHVQPRAKRTEIAGIHGDAVKLRVAAPPVDNAANKAVVAFFAKALKLPKSRVTITAGHTSRSKRIRISCDSADADGNRIRSVLDKMLQS